MERILKVRRLDGEDFILVRIARQGQQMFDLEFVATDGNAPYVAYTKQKGIETLRDQKNCTAQQWTTALSLGLFGPRAAGESARDAKTLEVVASSVDERHIVLTFRKTISDIAHRLGSITLERDDEREIELFSWTCVSASAATIAETALHEAQRELATQEKTIAELKLQLQALATTKSDHEKEMLAKFKELLDSKKQKIRDQQRLLAGAKVDPYAAAQVTATRAHRTSRSAKRKANEEPDSAMGGLSDEEEEQQDVHDSGTMTPDRSDDENTGLETVGAEELNSPSASLEQGDTTNVSRDEDETDDEL